MLSGTSVSLTAQDSAPARCYVSVSGNNQNDGSTPTGAFSTIRYALTQISAGDTLIVRDGVYVENGIAVRGFMGTAEQPTVLMAENQWGAKIEGQAQYNTLISIENSEHVVVEGFEVYHPGTTTDTDWVSGIEANGASFVTMRNNYVHDCGCNGISGREGDYFTIERNVLRGNGKTNPYNCSGISVFQPIAADDAPGFHMIVRDNVSFENECRLPFSPAGFDVPTDGNGIILDDFNWTFPFDREPEPPYRQAVLVENNLSFNNGGAGIKAFEVSDVTIRNNTTFHNNHVLDEFNIQAGEIVGESLSGMLTIANNIAVQGPDSESRVFSFYRKNANGSFDLRDNLLIGRYGRGVAQGTLANNTRMTADQQDFVGFADARTNLADFTFTSVDDFRELFALQEGSPALDAGNDELAADDDLTGTARPIGPASDLGAFEGAVETSSLFRWVEASPLRAYPNPTTGLLTIELPEARNATAEVFDVNGRSVLQQAGITNRAELDLGALANGVYIVRMEVAGRVFRQLVTVRH